MAARRLEERLQVGDDFLRQRCLFLVHTKDNARDAQIGIHGLTNKTDRLKQFPQPLQGQEMRLQRHEHFPGQRQGVEREQPKTRRAVDQHDVVAVFNRGELPRQDLLTIRPTSQLNLSGGQIDL